MSLQTTLNKATNIIQSYLPEAQPADIEDALQSACVKYLEKYNSLDNIAVSWLVRVSLNILIDTYRRSKKNCNLPIDIHIKNEHTAIADIKLDSTSDKLKEICDLFLYSDSLKDGSS